MWGVSRLTGEKQRGALPSESRRSSQAVSVSNISRRSPEHALQLVNRGEESWCKCRKVSGIESQIDGLS